MNKKIFLNRWIDWTLAVIIIVFIILWGAIQKYSIEQEYDFVGDDIFYSIKFHAKDKQPHGDYKNTTYRIDGKNIELKNGISEIEGAPGSASKIVTKYFGNEVLHDLDGDGIKDVAFLLTQETGGSGIFYYVVAALNTSNGYVGSQGLFLGDRIAPQTTEAGKGKIIVVNYADRARGESFSVKPSIGKSIWLLLDPKIMQFGEVVQDFEGESNLEPR